MATKITKIRIGDDEREIGLSDSARVELAQLMAGPGLGIKPGAGTLSLVVDTGVFTLDTKLSINLPSKMTPICIDSGALTVRLGTGLSNFHNSNNECIICIDYYKLFKDPIFISELQNIL